MIMHFSFKVFIPFLSLVFFQVSKAQNFNYTLTKDSTSYQPLSTTAIVADKEDWTNKKFSLNLPFQFNCAGVITDSLTIESNGFISFGANTNLALVAFNNFLCSMDTTGAFVSEISFLLSGSPGSRVAKLEFKNLSLGTVSPEDFFSYQLWFYEGNNKIEYHIGPHAYAAISVFPELIGVIRRRMDASVNGYLVTGSPSSPTGKQLNDEFSYIDRMPGTGTIYTFTPIF